MVNVMGIHSICEAIFSMVENVSGSLKLARHEDLGPATSKYSQYH